MSSNLSRRSFLAGSLGVAALAVMTTAGCGESPSQESPSIRIGTMPTEDILPYWVAEQESLFVESGLEAEIISFDSAQNLSAAITAGEVDIAMTDPMRAIKLCESGTALSMEWITLGTTAEQGRFGVLTAADSGVTSLDDLLDAELGVGVAANTVPEYVFDRLCEQAGVDPAKIVTSEVASLPDRYTLMAEGQLDAAALPGSMLALGEATGLVLLADDTTGDNLSQSVMVVRTEYKEGDAEALDLAREVWDTAAELINTSPDKYRELLAENANLNEAVVDTYPICEYPMATSASGTAAYPAAELIEPQIAWMAEKGYSESTVTYNESDGTFTIS